MLTRFNEGTDSCVGDRASAVQTASMEAEAGQECCSIAGIHSAQKYILNLLVELHGIVTSIEQYCLILFNCSNLLFLITISTIHTICSIPVQY
jgi:hypothetical protein